MTADGDDSSFALNYVGDLANDDIDEKDALARVFQVLTRLVSPLLLIRIHHVAETMRRRERD